MFIPDACRVEDFFTRYIIRRTTDSIRFFTARSSSDKIIIKLVDNDHGWRDTIIRIYGAWETVIQKDHGAILTTWNKETLMHSEIPVMEEAEERVQSLLQIGVDNRNWSWLLHSNRPSIPPSVSCTRGEVGSIPVIGTVAEKDGVEVSASRGGPKLKPEMREKRPHRVDPS